MNDATAVTFQWLGAARVRPDRVYALAMTADGSFLLVTDDAVAPQGWLSGGGREPGEDALEALRRELEEEAGATVCDHEFLGTQIASTRTGSSVFAYYWTRVALAPEFRQQHEITIRLLVRREEFLDTLTWGRRDPAAAYLLQRAIECDASARQRHRAGRPTHDR